MKEAESAHFSEEADGEPVGSEDEKEQKEPKEEKEDLHERLELIIKAISKKDIRVTSEVDPMTLIEMAKQGKDAHSTWYRKSDVDPKTKKVIGEHIHVPANITENENEAKGKAAHEAGHSAIYRFDKIVPEKVLQELGFPALLLACEERPTDQVVRERYAGAGEWVDEAREGSSVETAVRERGEEVLKRAKKMPKFLQLSDLIVYELHIDDPSKYYDQDVLEIYKKIQDAVERVEHEIPDEDAGEKGITASAKERYKIVYKEAWPIVKKLIEEDKKEEAENEMRRQAEKQKEKERKDADKQGEESGKGEKHEENLFDSLPEPIKKALQDAIEKALENMEKQKEKGVSEDEAEKELSRALEKIFNSLPEETKKSLLKKAIERLEALEDKLIEELSGKIIKNPPKTHAELHEEEEGGFKGAKKEKDEGEEEKIKAEMEDVEKKLEMIQEARGAYDKEHEKIHDLIDKFFRDLDEVFHPNIKRKVTLSSSGTRLNLPAVFRWEAAKSSGVRAIDHKIFEKVRMPEARDYAVTILVDLSGSMGGETIEETFRGVILLAEVLNRLGVPFEIIGFQDELIVFKKFDEKLNDAIRKKISGMLLEVSDVNPGGHNRAAFNDDGPCLLEASGRLGKQAAKEKFLWVLSDGMPCGRKSTDKDLTKAVEKTMETTDQKLVGLGLGQGTEHVKKFYPISFPNLDIKKLAESFGGVLEDMLLHPEKYVSRKIEKEKGDRRRNGR